MAIRTVAGSEIVEGARSAALVEVTDPADRLERWETWEFVCSDCESFATGLTESEAREEVACHVCPEIPPCERESLLDVEVPVQSWSDVRVNGDVL